MKETGNETQYGCLVCSPAGSDLMTEAVETLGGCGVGATGVVHAVTQSLSSRSPGIPVALFLQSLFFLTRICTLRISDKMIPMRLYIAATHQGQVPMRQDSHGLNW